ncbi:pup deamidase/depupylase domain protein [Mycobacterium kansasii 662]|uniref:Pup deamidase/depupylase domain protein n=1 Tax=Mycobacterium kansasii 662 TaxID=1299326 RepID=X7XQV3_MYCKA|nr:pup deamidase/depupylase domain protein [Mycobacterium kansasii 662]
MAKLVDSRDPDPRASDIVETWTHVLDLLERATRWNAQSCWTGRPSCGCSTDSGTGRI